ncbi:very-long-chain (3R)-3-hydroxyacyl-CoA dehydratase [Halyomorpha halys]|uniref:very-long-chain (3R)-3-hydroxyacyl-CoA dehydratase n=1 Tax=Halyomorpha halys TaxID=286706 RepID=UPI0006D4E0CC|nr:very-long-chain (3R)-3-hydroxyacyl-CoA dehydratase [Halyomorpha halys]
MVQTPSPFVYWAQDANNIYLKVDLKDIEDEDIQLDKSSMTMTAKGVGAHGPSKYKFTLHFFNDLAADDEVHVIKTSPRAIEFTLKKASSSWWSRLIKHQQKPAWLKIDFERWKSEDDDLSDSNIDGNSPRDVMGDYPELFEKLKKDEFGYVKEDFKKVYLVFYNLTQFIFYTYMVVVIGIRWMKEGPDSMPGNYEAVGAVLKFAQLIQYLEVMHPYFGYTKGNPLFPFFQNTGRSIVLFVMIEAEPRMQTKPVVTYLIVIWSLIELIRYPYYIAELYKKNFGFLTWLRYTIWIPLYPLGVLCEAVIVLRNIPYFEETQRFTVSMPNPWNVTFHLPSLMRSYLLFLLLPGLYAMMNHMYKARVKKLGPKQWKKKFS